MSNNNGNGNQVQDKDSKIAKWESNSNNSDRHSESETEIETGSPNRNENGASNTNSLSEEDLQGSGLRSKSKSLSHPNPISKSDSSSSPNHQQESSSNSNPNSPYNYNPGDRKFHGRKKKQYFFQFWRWREPPPTPPSSMDDAKEIPIVTANFLSELTFSYITPIMILGYRRPLETTDLWKMDKTRTSSNLSSTLNSNFQKRRFKAEERNLKIENGEINPSHYQFMKWRLESIKDRFKGNKDGMKLDLKEKERLWREKRPESNDAGFEPENRSGQDKATVRMAMYDQFSWTLWHGVIYKIVGDSLQLTSTLVLKEIIEFGQEVQAHRDDPLGHSNPSIGKGIGLSFALFFMVLLASVCQHRFFYLSMSVGVFSRTALISAIYSRALSLSGKARASGKLTNHISTDASRIDFAAAWFPLMLSAPIQLALCLILLCLQIGASAICGFAILVLASPAQTWTMKILFQVRRKSMQFTDSRSKLTQEILSGMRIVKSFAHENRFLQRLHSIRKKELNGIRTLIIIRSLNNAIAFSLPVIAAVISFIVYKATGHDLNPANIFSALTLFQLLRMPLMFLPLSFSASTDAWNAFERLDTVFYAQSLDDTSERLNVGESEFGLEIQNASFTWDQVEEKTDGENSKGKKNVKNQEKKLNKKRKETLNEKDEILPIHQNSRINDQNQTESEKLAQVEIDESNENEEGFIHKDDQIKDRNQDELDVTKLPKDGQISGIGSVKGFLNSNQTLESDSKPLLPPPFQLRNINLKVISGELLAIVGSVGSGKSSLLNASIGEMRKLNGRVIWGGKKIGYSSQSSWIQNATVRENILFGQEFDEERYWEIIKLSELESDLKMLGQGDLTSIGERGVTLSGGQKQRVNIARALYYDPDIFLFDDPLSALDASVGKSLFNNAILGLRKRGKTVILVTHALHFLPQCDRIVTMVDGAIAETGTYSDLMNEENGSFRKLVEEFGGDAAEEDEENKEEEEEGIERNGKDSKKELNRSEMTNKGGNKGGMEAEERNTGSVSMHVYSAYFKAGKGSWMLPAILISLALMQAATILNSYWLIWWQEEKFGQGQTGLYMGVYAALGVLVAIFTFLTGASTGFLSYWACKTLHYDAVQRLMYSPMSWYDVTPIGRIMNRLQKDIDVVDNQLSDSFRMLSNTFATVLGSVILITILTHYFVIAVVVIAFFYYYGAAFYRSSAREVKRLDAILRSSLYSHFGESLSGLVTIRAYGEIPRFKVENEKRMDDENRAYYISIVNQRWLGVRLDCLGAVMVLVVAILATAGSNSISPGQVGIALSYVVSVAQAASWLTRQVAETENNMNSAERILHYAEELDQEASQVKEDVSLPPSWPEKGEIQIKDLVLKYRPSLPAVLKGVTLDVKAGEKVAIVGRTGAGKSSLLTALLRLTELESGSVKIDGVDVSTIGLRQLRNSIAILPQDPLLFSGTLRSNLDPFSQYEDARLWDALRRAYLVDGPLSSSLGNETLNSSSSDDDEKEKETSETESNPNKVNSRLTLDSIIEEEGGNLSLGQRSLVSLARALVKDSRIVLLDEATASVDSETDSKIQETLRTEFADRTLLTIAHRLRSILSYDRVAVFDKGLVSEYDHPLKLFDLENGQFRSMCERSNIFREEILKASELNKGFSLEDRVGEGMDSKTEKETKPKILGLF